ncbi:GNAT family N-acetyltransferase [Hassallia byssoidea VB512170]|uniref:GNAT family N-acetyltransferase n=1 Tax=Hassallia byssoidea VB512170 TaxID=1304833 RepID=A0A846HBC5_9CYAN|nr:GNAT family N-acetyltransferase [Hassalia byssoidea]NEU73751.1 GNAT family N-acetyltransferase [Hassalia byssoidea VB512170]
MTNLLETERLIVRNWIPEQDAEQAFEIYGDPEVTYFLGACETSVESQRQSLTREVEQYRQLNNGTGDWAVVEKETARVVGAIILAQLPDSDRQPTEDYEIGWHFRRASWGKGYATEAGRGMLSYGFNILQLPVIYAVVKPEHHASIRVTQRLGMKPVGRTNKYYGIELLLFQLDAPERIGTGD